MPTAVSTSRLSPHAKLRLICLPYAGGGSAVFHRWRPILPADIDLVPLCLPGHDGRLREPPRTDLVALARELADDLRPAIDRPYALIGHSLGGWLAFELARELRRRSAPRPALLAVAGTRPPHAELPTSPLYLLPDAELIGAMQSRYDGIPPAILNNVELLSLLLPVLRADIQMVETYRYTDEPPLDTDMLVLGGSDDPAVSPAQLTEWRRHTARECSVELFPGGHFFLFRGEAQQATASSLSSMTPALQKLIDSLSRIVASA